MTKDTDLTDLELLEIAKELGVADQVVATMLMAWGQAMVFKGDILEHIKAAEAKPGRGRPRKTAR